MNKLTVIATYWNEIEWIGYSLKQIEKLDPSYVIIMDGNFDKSVPNYSTDGTREHIEAFIKSKPNYVLKKVSRYSKLWGLYNYFFKSPGSRLNFIYPWRLFSVAKWLFSLNTYRLNQCLNFNECLKLSPYKEPGNWLITIDADQFYSDYFFEEFRRKMNNQGIKLISAVEKTFPFDHRNYTEQYEKRTYNNMPHRIDHNSEFYPTRHLVRTNFWGKKLYNTDKKSIFDVGEYFHYKFRKDPGRLKAGYRLGDRSEPDSKRYGALLPFHGEHPLIVRDKFND